MFGRGHIAAANNSFITGQFSEETVAATDAAIFQVGIGATSGSRKNAITARNSGAVKLGATYTVATLPSASDAGAGSQVYCSDLFDGLGGHVTSNGTIWIPNRAGLTITNGTTTGTSALTYLTNSFDRVVTTTGALNFTVPTTGIPTGLQLIIRKTNASHVVSVNGTAHGTTTTTYIVSQFNGTSWGMVTGVA